MPSAAQHADAATGQACSRPAASATPNASCANCSTRSRWNRRWARRASCSSTWTTRPGAADLCGAEAAARRYFKRGARNLEPAQAVWLAAMLHNPGMEIARWQRDGTIDGDRAKWVAESVRGISRNQRDALLKSVANARFAPP